MTPSEARQSWLEGALTECRTLFEGYGYTVPDKIRVSVGFPRGSHGRSKAIGQCWDHTLSSDGHSKIFISPEINDSEQVLGVLVHELVHATVGTKEGHKGLFKQCAIAVGLAGKMTATSVGDKLKPFCTQYIEKHGAYPAGTLSLSSRKKQTTRLIKCTCQTCGYTVRVARKWIEEAGAPICPTDEEQMGE